FQQILADECCVPARAAGSENDPVDSAKLLRREIEAAEFGGGVGIVEPAPHRIFKSLRLLEDFLEHVVLKASQFYVALFDLQIVDEMVDPAMIALADLQRICRDEGDLMVGQIDDLVGPAGKR